MIFMSIRLVYDTRKLQKYVKMQGNWVLRGQNHVLCYFFRNMGLGWPILHQSWVQISYVNLENNLDNFHVNKTWFLHQQVAKLHHNARNWALKGSKLCYITAVGWRDKSKNSQCKMLIMRDILSSNIPFILFPIPIVTHTQTHRILIFIVWINYAISPWFWIYTLKDCACGCNLSQFCIR